MFLTRAKAVCSKHVALLQSYGINLDTSAQEEIRTNIKAQQLFNTITVPGLLQIYVETIMLDQQRVDLKKLLHQWDIQWTDSIRFELETNSVQQLFKHYYNRSNNKDKPVEEVVTEFQLVQLVMFGDVDDVQGHCSARQRLLYPLTPDKLHLNTLLLLVMLYDADRTADLFCAIFGPPPQLTLTMPSVPDDDCYRTYKLLRQVCIYIRIRQQKPIHREQKRRRQKNNRVKKKQQDDMNRALGFDDNICIICIDEQVSVKLEPCGHCVCCFDCAKNLKTCCMCRADIVSRTPYNPNTKPVQPTPQINYVAVGIEFIRQLQHMILEEF